MGIKYIDGCCGCEGSHIRQMARALGRMPEQLREWNRDDSKPQSATGNYQALRDAH